MMVKDTDFKGTVGTAVSDTYYGQIDTNTIGHLARSVKDDYMAQAEYNPGVSLVAGKAYV